MSSNRSASLNKFKVVLGYILLFISSILFSSFVSYMFNWKVDQSNVNSLFDRDVQVENILGKVGASISHFFIFKLFGIGSFVIPIILFITSYFILFNKKISSIFLIIPFSIRNLNCFSPTPSTLSAGLETK